ncbi:MAG: dTMP kinase [Acidimicrobiales bacterium]
MTTMNRGKLIALEGGEACGKTTQTMRLAKRLGAVLTREPGGTVIGEQIRNILLDTALAALVPRTEALLMAAARAQHIAEVIVPALEAGTHVVTDRFIGSSLAYQGFGRGLELDEVRSLSTFAGDGLDADIVILLDIPKDQMAERLGKPTDRLEAAGDDFHDRVFEGFKILAANESDRWLVVDGTGTPDEVEARIWSVVEARLNIRGPAGPNESGGEQS